jgi:hypothetical protein
LLPIAAVLLLGAAPASAQAATTASVSVTPTVVDYGASVTYSMTVKSGSSGVTLGVVSFTTGGMFLCSSNTPNSGGTFSCAATTGPAGVDVISGIYVDQSGTFENTTASTGSDANPSNCGSTGQPTCPLTVNVAAPPAPSGSSGSKQGTGVDHGGSISVTSGELVVQANGAGGVTAANYPSNPTGSTPVAATGRYDDVATGTGSGFSSVDIAECDYGPGSSLQWFDASTSSWVEFSAQSKNIACLFAVVTAKTTPSLSQLVGLPIAVSILPSPTAAQGYWLVARDGGIFSYNRPFFGSTGSIKLNEPIVGMATTNDENGYWMVGADGGIFAFGDAVYGGSLPGKHVSVSNIVAIVSDPSTDGYYEIGSDGSVWNFNAPQLGDLPFFGFHVNDIVGGAMTPDNKGMYLVGANGKVYVMLGDGAFQGDASGLPLNAPIVSMAVDPVTGGYWLVGKDGGVFSYGAPFYGSTGSLRLNQPVITMASTGDGAGYWFTALDGGVFSYGDAQFWGSTGSIHLNQPVIGMSGS